MKEFYLSGVLNKEKSTQETIIDILKARGFLIDYVDGHFYKRQRNGGRCPIP